MTTTIVAIPKFGETVAPCFEAASVFLVARIEDGRVMSETLSDCTGCEGFGRIQILRDLKIDTLICNGIKGFYHDLLMASGVTVIAKVSGSVSAALEAFATGELKTRLTKPVECPTAPVPLDDLVCWTRELFTAHGYEVQAGTDFAPFPIDLIAEINCPVCNRKVRVAICCGAHAYRPEKEIEQLHLAASGGYDARVYVRPSNPTISRHCREYGVELIDPDARFACGDHPEANRIPILQMPVAGHELASGTEAGPEEHRE